MFVELKFLAIYVFDTKPNSINMSFLYLLFCVLIYSYFLTMELSIDLNKFIIDTRI